MFLFVGHILLFLHVSSYARTILTKHKPIPSEVRLSILHLLQTILFSFLSFFTTFTAFFLIIIKYYYQHSFYYHHDYHYYYYYYHHYYHYCVSTLQILSSFSKFSFLFLSSFLFPTVYAYR